MRGQDALPGFGIVRGLQSHVSSYGYHGFPHNGGALEVAQDMATHSDPRTTKLYIGAKIWRC